MSPARSRRESALVRSYVITGGRARPEWSRLDPAALVEPAGWYPATGLDPDQRRVLDVGRGGALSIIEVAAYTRLPLSVTLVVVGDLLHAGHLCTRTPIISVPEQPGPDLLREVLDGLRRLTV